MYRDGEGDSFPSSSREKSGRFVAIAHNIGHIMTCLILTDDTQKVVPRSRVRLATEDDPNLRVEPLQGEDFQEVMKPLPDTTKKPPPEPPPDGSKLAPTPIPRLLPKTKLCTVRQKIHHLMSKGHLATYLFG